MKGWNQYYLEIPDFYLVTRDKITKTDKKNR